MAGWGGEQRQDVMRRSYQPCASAGQGRSRWIYASRPFHSSHVSTTVRRQGTAAPLPTLHPHSSHHFPRKKSTSWLAVSKTSAFHGNAAPLHPLDFLGELLGRYPPSPCAETAGALMLHYNPRKAQLWLSSAPIVLAGEFGPWKGPGLPLRDF